MFTTRRVKKLALNLENTLRPCVKEEATLNQNCFTVLILEILNIIHTTVNNVYFLS